MGRRSCPAPIQDVMMSCDDEQCDPSINIPNDEVKRLSLARAKRITVSQFIHEFGQSRILPTYYNRTSLYRRLAHRYSIGLGCFLLWVQSRVFPAHRDTPHQHDCSSCTWNIELIL